ncbi:dolichol kinase [Tilletia horrida]|nr:dolichol kinase [Tilletia horrida]
MATTTARRRPSSTERQQQQQLKQSLLRKPRNYLEAGLLFACAAVLVWRLFALDDPRANALAAGEFPGETGAIWATDLRAFRPSLEDGAVFGLLMGPLVAATLLLISVDQLRPESFLFPNGERIYDPRFRIEGPVQVLKHARPLPQGTSTLILSRYSLLSMQNLISTIFFAHVLAARYLRNPEKLPRSTLAKTRSFALFAASLVSLLIGVHGAVRSIDIPLWSGLETWEFIVIAMMYQVDLFTVTRLARRNFTIGELGIVAQLGGIIALESIHFTAAKLWPVATDFVKSYRHPTPLIIFQLALTAGTFLVGFLLSPILYLSRHLAQKPTHRLRWPEKRNLHRRLLSASFYVFAAIYVLGVLGMWVRWLLVKRDPWLWTLRFLLQGAYPFSRFALVAYWTSLIGASVFSWQMVVTTVKRPPPINNRTTPALAAKTSYANMSSEPNSAPRKAVHLSLNARRKFFHFLAVLLFLPGILWDPALMHLAFSLAFSLFIFIEYVRYFALLPFGASLHIFLAQFLDSKDAGPVILSHFYLLSGCAASLWLEGPSPIYDIMGVLVLGIGDALASILGRKYGRHTWPGSPKTLEGSVTFVLSIVLCAWLLRVAGFMPPFSLLRFTAASIATGLMEGASEQNDNLILPLFAFVVMFILHV